MRSAVNTAVVVVCCIVALAVAIGSASAAARSCGPVNAKLPSGSTQGYLVKVAKGTISCAKAAKLITGVYLAPGLASSGPNNTGIDRLKSGWRCVFGGTPPEPIACTKGTNTVKATPTP